MKIHVLGIYGPFPAGNGATSGYLAEEAGTLVQFDLGSGILSRLTARTAPEKLSAVFLSHWHFDHASDISLLMYRLQSVEAVLPVYAPKDENSLLYRMVAEKECFRLSEIAPGDSVKVGNLTVQVGPARHPVPTVGFRVTGSDGAFGYTGDTNTLPSLPSFYRGCRLLLADGLLTTASWKEKKPHMSAALAAQLAADAGCDRLVITHLNPFTPPAVLLEEARKEFRNVSLAAEGTTLTV